MNKVKGTSDDEDVVDLIANAPEISPEELSRAQEGRAIPSTPTSDVIEKELSATSEPVDEKLADLGAKAVQEALKGFDVPSSNTIEELSGTLIADVAGLLPSSSSRLTRIAAISVLLAIVAAPPVLRVFGVISTDKKTEDLGVSV